MDETSNKFRDFILKVKSSDYDTISNNSITKLNDVFEFKNQV